MLLREEQIDPRLIKPRKDPTLGCLEVKLSLIPEILIELITRTDLGIIRAMNYAKILNNYLYKIDLPDLLNMFDFDKSEGIDAVMFFGSLAPGSFKLYTYWYSRFLYRVAVTGGQKYKQIKDLDLKILKTHLYGEARRGLAPSTVRVQLSAIRHLLYPFEEQFKWLYYNDISLKKLFQFIYNIWGKPAVKRRPVTFHIIYKILETINYKILIDVRDWVLIILLHIAGFRGGETASARWINVYVDTYQDTYSNKTSNIFMLKLDSTKTANQSEGALVTISCPVEQNSFNILSIIKLYILKLKKEGYLNDYLFPSLNKRDQGKNKHIVTNTISKMIKKRVKSVGLDPKLFGAHSFRTAFVHDAVAAGIPEPLIQKTGRWKSKCWLGYFHDAQYAQAQTTSRLNEYGKKFETQKSSKKHKELLKALSDKI